ncbi:MAG: hypothetical protein WC365_07835 [Candidatus Babeliales bacterium]|jgi:hypothetical protein
MKLKELLKVVPHYVVIEIKNGNPADSPIMARDFPDGQELKPHYERTVCQVVAAEKRRIVVGVYDRRSPVRY